MKTSSNIGLLILLTTSTLAIACDGKSGLSKEPAAASSAAVEKAEPAAKPTPSAAEGKKPEKDDKKDKGGW